MRYRISALLSFLLIVLFSGCGNSFDDAPRPGFQPQPVGNATIQVNHILARAVPSGIDTFRFLGQDSDDQIVYGPEERSVQADITLNDVTVLTRVFTIEYLSRGEVVGRFVTEVSLTPGEIFEINDPNWVDVGDFGPPVALQFMVEPSAALSGRAFNPAVTVVVVDALGRQVEDFNGPVTIALGPGSPSGTLSGTLTVNAVAGIATFPDLSINLVGNGFTLVATADTLTSVTSSSFGVDGSPFSGASDSIVYRATFDPTETHFSCGDINDDGVNDVALSTETELQVLLGTPDGGFEVASTTALSDIVLVKLGDVTGDGFTDVVVLVDETTEFTTQVLPGDGTGSLGTPVATSMPVSSGGAPSAMELADLNGDDRDDAVIVGTDGMGGAYYVEISNGTGLGDPTRFALTATPADMALAQLLGDASSDMVIAVGSDLEVFTGAGNGTFTSTTSVTPAFPPEAVSVADIDGQDGNDLVTAYADGSVSSETAVYLNSVVNPFTTQALGSPYNLGQNEQDVIVEEVAVGDLNGDGVPDLAQVTQVTTSTAPVTITDPLVFVQLSDLGDGGTLFPTTTRYELAVDSTEIELCDFSADGLLDALLNGEQSNLTRLNSNAQGDLLPSTTPADSNDAVGVLTGDVNNDNREDVVTRDDENIFVYLRDASGVVPDSPDFTIDTGIVGGEVLRLADMNDDTFLDAVIGGNNSSEIVIFPNPGTGDFDETMTTTVTFTNSIDIFAVGLLNGDAFPDIVTDNNSGNGLQVALTNGELSYDASMLVAGSSEVRDLRLINLDADSELEVVTAQAVPGLGVYQNSAGTLSEDTVIPLDGNEVQQVEVGDLNGDGIADVVASGRLANFSEVYVLLNQQNGSLGISQTLSDARVDVIVDILVGDANNDGASDILLADADTGGIAVLTGSGDGTTFNNSLAHYFAGGDIRGESSLALSDLNGDGENEILVTTPASGALITLLTLFLLYCLRALRVRRHRVA